MKKCGKCGKCEIHDPDMENSYYGCWDCDTMYCGDCEHDIECEDCLEYHCPKEDCVCEIIPCIKCDCNNITKNSTDYYAMKCDDNGENFICDICYEGEYDENE